MQKKTRLTRELTGYVEEIATGNNSPFGNKYKY